MDDMELKTRDFFPGYLPTLAEDCSRSAKRIIKQTQAIKRLECLLARAEEDGKAGMVLYYQVMIEEHANIAVQKR